MRWKEILANYLSFTRKDRIAIIVILLLILFVFFLPQLITPAESPNPAKIDTAWITTLKKLEQKDSLTANRKAYTSTGDDETSAYSYARAKSGKPGFAKGVLFYFDPNTLPADGWKKLGLREKTIGTILKFRSKGGRFQKPEDLQKIYGLFPDEYERLAPYISIVNKQKMPVETVTDVPAIKPEKPYAPRFSVIDINQADTTAFISLPGIGNKLATRIINFREKLGGFYSIDQVGETFGLPDSTFKKIKPLLKLENIAVKKININTATEDELKAHPYIRYGLARPIVAYRKENGPFSKLEDIRNVMAVTESAYKKIVPYLTR